VSEKHTNLEPVWLKNIRINFDDIWPKCSKDSRIELFQFSCRSAFLSTFVNRFKVGAFFETQCIMLALFAIQCRVYKKLS